MPEPLTATNENAFRPSADVQTSRPRNFPSSCQFTMRNVPYRACWMRPLPRLRPHHTAWRYSWWTMPAPTGHLEILQDYEHATPASCGYSVMK